MADLEGGGSQLNLQVADAKFGSKSVARKAAVTNPVVKAVLAVDPAVLKGVAAAVGLFMLFIGLKVSLTMVAIMGTCMGMLVFAAFLARWVLRKDEGTADMQEVGGWLWISDAIRDGAEGYFATQYGTIARLAGLLAAAIFAIYLFRRETAEQQAAGVNRIMLACLTSLSFLLGAVCSSVAG
eukprot:scaffold7.g3500.t1